ncbi:MAG: ABC transporter ATP-binding protein [Patescibacteria group bacterium]|jgi:ABC-type polysaccharide/polyol phosphate transport system ATPase subunit
MTILEEKILYENRFSDEVVINLTNVSKKYIITHEKPTLVEDVNRILRFQQKEEYWALKNINLKIYKGEKVGFYGLNGVGKTTLLKIIAGISAPTRGKVKTKGKIVSLISLDAGFHPDLTGQENIFLNGLVIGMSRSEIKNKFKQIIDFAGIGDFITAPLYTYSSGMRLRLGFSIAIHAQPDILLLDEIITMGDEQFRKKTSNLMKKMFNNGVTLLIVSHQLQYLRANCNRLIELTK